MYIPTKNIPRLCRAFRLARQLAPQTVPPRLVLAGRLGWERRFPLNGARDITVLGHVSDADLATLYGTCTAFTFPSIYEGFGIPVHEALMAGAPVLCSDIPVFHEIAGDLVHYADPHDDTALAEAIVTRCRQPGAPPARVDQALAAYTPAAAGQALLRAYQTSS